MARPASAAPSSRSSEEKVYGEVMTMLRHYDTLSFLTMQFYIAFLSAGLLLHSNGKIGRWATVGSIFAVSTMFFLIAARLRQNHHHFSEAGKQLEDRLVDEGLRPIYGVQKGLREQPRRLTALGFQISSLYFSVYILGSIGGIALVLLGIAEPPS